MLHFHTHIRHRLAHALSISSWHPEPTLLPTLSAVTSSLKLHSLLPKLNPGEFSLQLQTPHASLFSRALITTGCLLQKLVFALWAFAIHFSFNEFNQKTTFFFFFTFAFFNITARHFWETGYENVNGKDAKFIFFPISSLQNCKF